MAVTSEERAKLHRIAMRTRPADLARTLPYCEGNTCGNYLLTERDWRTGYCVYCRSAHADARGDFTPTWDDHDPRVEENPE